VKDYKNHGESKVKDKKKKNYFPGFPPNMAQHIVFGS
jgi:hypothetical protein